MNSLVEFGEESIIRFKFVCEESEKIKFTLAKFHLMSLRIRRKKKLQET